jgi:hypothetical protein
MRVLSLSGCDDGADGGKGGSSIPSEIVGEWAAKANPSEMLFKITSDGTFTATGQSGGNFDKISVSGKTVEIKVSGSTVASFDYSISNGEMAISNATGFMAPIAFLSPFVKIGSSNSNSGGLSALVGEWYKPDPLVIETTPAFEITSAGKLIMNNTTYDISVSGSTATLKFGGTTVGTFDYAISNGQMVIFNGTGIGMTIFALSPLEKADGGGANVIPTDPPSGGSPGEDNAVTTGSV